jgi:hypothetical protein
MDAHCKGQARLVLQWWTVPRDIWQASRLLRPPGPKRSNYGQVRLVTHYDLIHFTLESWLRQTRRLCDVAQNETIANDDPRDGVPSSAKQSVLAPVRYTAEVGNRETNSSGRGVDCSIVCLLAHHVPSYCTEQIQAVCMNDISATFRPWTGCPNVSSHS